MFDNTNLDKPQYVCVKDFRTIKVDDVATVEFRLTSSHNQICVTSQRHSYFVNHDTLDEYFKKEE